MKKLFLFPQLVIITTLFMQLFSVSDLHGQACNDKLPLGQNLVVNGDFSMGDTQFSTPYASWNDPNNGVPCSNNPYNPMNCPRFWSSPGEYWVHPRADDFNPGAFSSVPSPRSGGNMMLVDAQCVPGGIIWEQTVEVIANTNYYFSLYIASIHPLNPAKLSFEVNGVILGTQVNAPAGVNQWLFYEDVWHSGSLDGMVQLRIREQSGVGCTNGDDFAIDDISFIPGCVFGAPGPIPNLGPDRSLCLDGSPLTLSTGLTPTSTMQINWSTGASGTGLDAPYTINVNTPGTYSVCVSDNGSCVKSDIIVINNEFSVNIGPDVNLCNPTTATFDAGINTPGSSYVWYRNGTELPGQTNRTYTANSPGTYRVEVTIPGCGMRSDEAVVTTQAAVPNDATFCPPAAVNLSVTGTGVYEWYDAPTGGNLLHSGANYTTPVLNSGATYYVKDASVFNYNVGPLNNSGFSGVNNVGPGGSDHLVFNALNAFRLDSITVYPYNYYCPGNGQGNANIINIVIYDASNNVVGTSNFTAQCTGEGQPAGPVRVPVGINIPQGNGYTMRLGAGSTQIALYLTNSAGFTYPRTYFSTVEFVRNSPSFNQWHGEHAFPGFFNWKISSGANCARVPVRALDYCPCPVTDPTSASSDVTTFCSATTSQVTLSVTGGSGAELVWYSGACGSEGVEVARNANGNPVTITAPTVQTTYFARWVSGNCGSKCVSVTVYPVAAPTVADAGTVAPFCNNNSIEALNANTATTGIGTWSVVSGTGTITSPNLPNSSVTNIGPGELVLKWTITNDPCPASESNVTIRRDTLTQPVVSGQTGPCGPATGLVFSTSHDRSANTNYDWSATGNVTITATGNNSATVDVAAGGGVLTLIETFGVCSFTVNTDIVPVNPPDVSDAGADSSFCNLTSLQLYANNPSSGTGTWSIISGTAQIADPNLHNSQITNIGEGNLVLEWTIQSGSCPESKSQVTITRDTLSVPVIIGTLAPCELSTGLSYSTSVNNFSKSAIYSWTPNGSLSITGQNENGVTVDVGADGGTLTVTEEFRTCKLSANVKIDPVRNPDVAAAGTDSSFCNNSSITLYANNPSIGKGEWKIESGSGSISDPTLHNAVLSGLLPGEVKLVWTISHNPCPASTDTITITRDTLSVPQIVGDNISPCEGTADLEFETLHDNSGKNAIYTWSVSGNITQTNASGNKLTVTVGAGGGTIEVTETAGACRLSNTRTITPVIPPDAANAGKDSSICNITSINLYASNPQNGAGSWSIYSGGGTLTNPSSPNAILSGIGNEDVVLVWTVTNNPCQPTTDTVVIHRDVLTAPAISGLSLDTCAMLENVVYTSTVDRSATSTYTWAVTGSLTITSNSANSVNVNIGATGGTLSLTEESGACRLSTSRPVGILENVSGAYAGTDRAICLGTTVLNATPPLVGLGQWSVKSGTADFSDIYSHNAAVSGLTAGTNILTWTVSGCGGPLSDDVVIEFGPSDMHLALAGPNDTACVNTPRLLNLGIAGGSGNYQFYWGSSDSSYKHVGNEIEVYVSPSAEITKYYVIALDLDNPGCYSNPDSVILYSVSKENLWFNNLITANGDGKNDRFIARDEVTMLGVLPGSKLEVFNRWGTRVYRADSYDNTWSPDSNIAPGIYYYTLTSGCGGHSYKGWVQILK
ncbi:MAG: gliding motility-associated C-terminal domain-containing protein [Cytophagaceae bacterium]